MLAISVGIFLWIRSIGEHPYSAGPADGGVAHAQINTLLHVLVALCVVVMTARGMAAIFQYFGQPPVIGEVVGGILLGPSFLGRFAPKLGEILITPNAIPFLGVISQVGVILYMFLVGLELDLKVLKKSGHTTLAISHASIIAPFLLGSTLALYIYQAYAPANVKFTVFALFMGVSMSVTAFPVLARILTDRQISRTRMGAIALTCAAIDDVTAWCLLALVISVAQSRLDSAVFTLLLTIGYIAAMFMLVRPLILKAVPFLETFDRLTQGGMAVIIVALLLSALATEMIGIHAIFGAFLLGAITPHNSRTAAEVTEKLQDLVQVMFLPAFFAFTGMRTQFSLLSTQEHWILCGIIIVVATIGKFGGTLAASKLSGLGWRDSAALGVLMNTRGLVELIVLNIGLDLKVLTPTLFTMLVIMAIVTTFMTSPFLHLLIRNHPWREERAAAR